MTSKDIFERNIVEVKLLTEIYRFAKSNLTALDLSDILRSEIVMAVSAFDCLLHDIVKSKMMDKLSEPDSQSKSLQEFPIPLNVVQDLISQPSEEARQTILSVTIKQIIHKDSYQSARNIDNALRLISVNNIWFKIKDRLGLSVEDIKSTLGLIIRRRNKICHEADIDPLTNKKIQIDENDVIDMIDFIHELGIAIYDKIDEL